MGRKVTTIFKISLYAQFFCCMSFSIIPITIAGLGARESISVLLFNEPGITPEVTISAFIILLFVRYVSSATLLLYYTWKKKH